MSTETQTLELAPAQTPVEQMKRADLPVIWDGFRAQAEKLKTTAETLTITDISQTAEMKIARTTRLALKEIRVGVENGVAGFGNTPVDAIAAFEQAMYERATKSSIARLWKDAQV